MVEQLSVPHQHTPSLQEVVQGLDDTQLAASLRGIDDDQVQRIVQCLHGLNNYGNQRLEQSGVQSWARDAQAISPYYPHPATGYYI
ncbi:uncharacterized protein BKA55DRAFT_562472 [Fusarium redolens]|uniref:Uncharacterized protein n=1 Tax=Fusarium redolens TaxID=48865 RepID=A0A9P9HLG8_FUSRE|nr:uncharacterized protein BKA55DRAFT_562472 [Fusarium redolens]KAH7259386.1 hypothetical protein BKA55DRAFT_562472 [Fusarium redolens]